jgi:CDP-4-dehydro-6-deoxyglucose reductase
MSFRITIKPSGHVYTTQDDETILEAALREGFSLPYGCRDGACGSCKGTVLDGKFDYGDAQESALSAEERQAGKALFCCAKPLSDLTIECREINAVKDIPVKIMPCRVQKMQKLAPDVMALFLKIPANERLQFLAGQYIDILMKDGKRRAFSIANAPHHDDLIELHVRNIAGGAFTEHVFGGMKEKDILRFEGPLGSFFLREDSEKPIVFVAGGTGFAPLKGILEHAFASGTRREMVLYWGGRALPDLYMLDLPKKWQEMYVNFKFIPVLSDPLPEDNWQGRTGLVHEAVLADYRDLSGHQVYACGAPAMVETAHTAFTTQRKLPEDEFFSDAFLFSKDSQPKK